ncbi:restriction endonuclease subunit S [Endozoicomonas euniceicola]|uniref:Restriction endonuclease subunit S n=1 Tax=Endozoicomonas euniceicola TaxID=1234143 RepID=A0ABY6GZH2_9GAMM|nr:restriction endonuclease subunit S [Endozoicomonas euniceicola]UYM18186.1 restriction endonuclease subunit S [Endozoicomonas euniceicola]
MVSKWPLVKFKTLYKQPSRNGLTKPKKVRGEGYKFINMGEVFAYGRMHNIPCDRVPMTEKEKSNSFLEDGDLLFARQSLVLSGAGKCSIFLGDDEETTFESHLIRVRLDQEKVNPEYAYYYFNSPQGRANISTIVEQGAGQAGIRGSDLENLAFPLPPKEAQDFIADMARPTDIKIELNSQTNQTLENMAQALFKSWFVDFDPVIDNALAAGNTIPEPPQKRAELRQAMRASDDAPAPLPEAIRQLFPASFVFDAEMGWIPEGWGVQQIGKVIENVGGGTPRTKEDAFWVDGTHAFCTPKDMSLLTSKALLGTERHLTDAGVAKISSGQLPEGTVLMSSRAPIGYLAINDIPVSVNQGIIAMKPNDAFSSEYLLSWAEANMEEVVSRAMALT